MLSIRGSLGFAAFGFVLITANSVHANLLTNGSFEQGPTLAPGGITPLGPADLPGWTLNGSNPWFWYMDSGTSYGIAEDGTKFINITSPSLSQGFAVTAGTTYTVSYYEALRQDGGGQPDTVLTTISLGAGAATGVTSQVANNPLTNNFANPNWQLFTFAFTPNTTTTATLEFALNNGAGYPVLDNVSVVPEPASLGLVGIAGASLLARRRRA